MIHMFQARAKGTALAENSHAMLTLQTTCSNFSQGHEVTQLDFNKGVTEALRASPDGPVAQWILQELQDLASSWRCVRTPAATGAATGASAATDTEAADAAPDSPLRCCYVNATDGTTTWTKPAVVAAMESFAAMRDAVEVSIQSRREGKQRASTYRQQRSSRDK